MKEHLRAAVAAARDAGVDEALVAAAQPGDPDTVIALVDGTELRRHEIRDAARRLGFDDDLMSDIRATAEPDDADLRWTAVVESTEVYVEQVARSRTIDLSVDLDALIADARRRRANPAPYLARLNLTRRPSCPLVDEQRVRCRLRVTSVPGQREACPKNARVGRGDSVVSRRRASASFNAWRRPVSSPERRRPSSPEPCRRSQSVAQRAVTSKPCGGPKPIQAQIPANRSRPLALAEPPPVRREVRHHQTADPRSTSKLPGFPTRTASCYTIAPMWSHDRQAPRAPDPRPHDPHGTRLCALCVAAADATAPDHPFLHNTPLAETPRFVVIPSVGPFTPGHVMVVSKTHQPSLLAMGAAAVYEYDALAERIRLLPVWNATVPLEAEHGSTTLDSGGACVVHCHVHWIPGTGLHYDTLASRLHHLPRRDSAASPCGPTIVHISCVLGASRDSSMRPDFPLKRCDDYSVTCLAATTQIGDSITASTG